MGDTHTCQPLQRSPEHPEGQSLEGSAVAGRRVRGGAVRGFQNPRRFRGVSSNPTCPVGFR